MRKIIPVFIFIFVGGSPVQAAGPTLEEVIPIVQKEFRHSTHFKKHTLKEEEFLRIEKHFPKLGKLLRSATIFSFEEKSVISEKIFHGRAFVWYTQDHKITGWVSSNSSLTADEKKTLADSIVSLDEVMGGWDAVIGQWIESPVPAFNQWFFSTPLESNQWSRDNYNNKKDYSNNSKAPDAKSLIKFGYVCNGDQWYYHKKTHEVFGCPRGDGLTMTKLFVPVEDSRFIEKAMYKGKPLKYEAYVDLVAESYLEVIEGSGE